MVGHGGHRDAAARPRHRAADQGRRQRAVGDQPRAGDREVRQARLRGHHHHRAGQRSGRARARPQVRPAARATATSPTRPTVRTSPRCGVATRPTSSSRASPPGDHRGDPRPADEGIDLDLLQPHSIGAQDNFTAEALDRLSSTRPSTSSCRSPATTPTSCCPGSLHEEDEGTSTSGEGRIIKINAAVKPARPPPRLGDAPGRPRAPGRGRYLPSTATREMFEELRVASAGGTADYRGATWERIEDEMGLFWPVPRRATRAPPGSSRTAASPTPTAGPGSTASPSGNRPRWSTTSTRSGSPPAGS